MTLAQGTSPHRVDPHPRAPQALRSAQIDAADPDPVHALKRGLGPGPFAMVTLFVSPEADFARITHEAHQAFPGAEVLACTTAGEIGVTGYVEGQIVAAGFPAALFSTRTVVFDELSDFDPQPSIDRVIRARVAHAEDAPRKLHEFAFLMIDGMSLKEDEVAGAMAAGLGPVPLFGGSAGDGARFGEALVSRNGVIYENGALLALVRSACRVRVFSLDHLQPTRRRMVVTEADPTARIVHQINAEPAAQEYARVLGHDPAHLTPSTFAAHPVVVRLGGRHHVRAIRRVTEDGSLIFFSAIDEGMVLTLAEPENMATHLQRTLDEMFAEERPETILACDCILRRLEAGEKQMTRDISQILSGARIIGFGTYGEQMGAMHVNHTLTGVAVFAPDPPGDPASTAAPIRSVDLP